MVSPPRATPDGDSSGSAIGVAGITNHTYGVFGWDQSGSAAGVYGQGSGQATGAIGVMGEVIGNTQSGVVGVRGKSGVTGVWGTGSFGAGVYGENMGSGAGIYGQNNSGNTGSTVVGVYGQSVGGSGVYGLSSATSSGVAGVYGQNTGGGSGVYGTSTGLNGVEGHSTKGGAAGVYGEADSNGNGTATFGVAGRITPAGPGAAIYGDNDASGSFSLAGSFHGSVAITRNLTVSGTCNGSTCSCDIRLKKNVQALTGSLDTLARLRPVTFEWKDPERGTGTQMGFIAQEVEKVRPDWVGVDAQGFKTLDNTKLQVMLIDSVRVLKEENDALKGRVKALEANRRPLNASVFGESGLGLAVLAGAYLVSRRRRSIG